MDGIAGFEPAAGSRSEWARFIRPTALPGAEFLHATFVSHRYSPHVHNSWTIALVETGAAAFELERGQYVASAGSVFLIPPGAVHTGASASPGGYRYRVVYLEIEDGDDDGGASTLPASTGPAVRCRVVLRDDHLALQLTKLHQLVRLKGRGLEQGEVLASVTVALRSVTNGDRQVECSTHSAPTVRALEYVRAHWQDDFSLDDLSRATGTSKYHLVRSFHHQVGVAPSGYRRALRVAAAQRLLRRGWPPGAVAAECGFYDQSHLNRHFKSAYGVTPSQYANAAS